MSYTGSSQASAVPVSFSPSSALWHSTRLRCLQPRAQCRSSLAHVDGASSTLTLSLVRERRPKKHRLPRFPPLSPPASRLRKMFLTHRSPLPQTSLRCAASSWFLFCSIRAPPVEEDTTSENDVPGLYCGHELNGYKWSVKGVVLSLFHKPPNSLPTC